MDATPSATTTFPSAWQQHSLERLQRLLRLTPAQAPAELTEWEAFALIEWCRMTAFADCRAAGAEAEARALVRGRAR